LGGQDRRSGPFHGGVLGPASLKALGADVLASSDAGALAGEGASPRGGDLVVTPGGSGRLADTRRATTGPASRSTRRGRRPNGPRPGWHSSPRAGRRRACRVVPAPASSRIQRAGPGWDLGSRDEPANRSVNCALSGDGPLDRSRARQGWNWSTPWSPTAKWRATTGSWRPGHISRSSPAITTAPRPTTGRPRGARPAPPSGDISPVAPTPCAPDTRGHRSSSPEAGRVSVPQIPPPYKCDPLR
jgi:hypothetical protein